MNIELKNGQLVITLPVNDDPQPSSTGKSLTVATTHGIMTTNVMVNGLPLKVGVNAFIANAGTKAASKGKSKS